MAALSCLQLTIRAAAARLAVLQVLQLKGFSHAAKDRWVVVAPRFSPPSEGSGGVGIVRIMMLVYRCGASLWYVMLVRCAAVYFPVLHCTALCCAYSCWCTGAALCFCT